MPTYKIDAGNSNDGPIGFVAYVNASNRREARATVKDRLGRDEHRVVREEGLEVLVYFNLDHVKIDEIELDR